MTTESINDTNEAERQELLLETAAIREANKEWRHLIAQDLPATMQAIARRRAAGTKGPRHWHPPCCRGKAFTCAACLYEGSLLGTP